MSEDFPRDSNGTLNAMTVDVEEHFQVSAFASVVRPDEWGSFPSRVGPNTERLLDLLDEVQVRATFFVLGWIAERHGPLVRKIAERGHEVASHGYGHRLVYDQRPAEFLEETVRAKKLVEDASGQLVRGYRAASFSITRRCLWAVDVLADAGFTYDSSLFPVRHDRYGIPGAPRGIHRLRTPQGGSILEFPPSTLCVAGFVLPTGGGGYLRLYPRRLTNWTISRLNRVERMPAMIYVHPWELDPEQPRIRAPWRSRFRHYSGLGTTRSKLRELLSRYRFGAVADVLSLADDVPERALA